MKWGVDRWLRMYNRFIGSKAYQDPYQIALAKHVKESLARGDNSEATAIVAAAETSDPVGLAHAAEWAVMQAPKDANAYLFRAMVRRSYDDLCKGIRLAPNQAVGYIFRGIYRTYTLKDPEGGRDDYDKAIALGRSDILPLRNLADMIAKRDKKCSEDHVVAEEV